MVPCHFFSDFFCKQTKKFFVQKYIAPLQLGKNWKAKLVDDRSDIKRLPY